MASPYRDGSYPASILTSKQLAVVSEKIKIKPLLPSTAVQYYIQYQIEHNGDSATLPLLFVALDYAKGFKLKVNGVKVAYSRVAELPHSVYDSIAVSFADYLNEEKKVKLQWTEMKQDDFPLEDLLYFEIKIANGINIVEVEYEATPSVDLSERQKKYILQYSLAPSQHWKGFTNLEIELLNSIPLKYTNLFQEPQKTDSSLIWKYKQVPSSFIEFTFQQPLVGLPALLDKFGKFPLTLLVYAILLLILIFRVYPIVAEIDGPLRVTLFTLCIFGVPIICVLFYILFDGWIDQLIGDTASKYHGYNLEAIPYFLIFTVLQIIALAIFQRFNRK